MLKCNKCSESVHKKFLVICEKCEFCYHLPCVSEFIDENKCFVCENCRLADKKLKEISQALENVENKVTKLSAVKEETLVDLVLSLRNINEEISIISSSHDEEILSLVQERFNVVGNCSKKLLFCVEEIEDELKVCEDLCSFVHWIEDVGQKSVGSVEEANILLETILEGRKTLDKFLYAAHKLDNLEENYLVVINNFRVSKGLEPIKRSPNLKLREDLSKTAKNYDDLLQRVRKFLDWISDGQGLREDTEQSLLKVERFLDDLEPKVKLLVQEPVAKESRLLKKQEKRAKYLKTQLIANKNLIDDAMETSSKLLKTYEDFISPQEITESVKVLENKYEDFNRTVEVKHQQIFQALTYSQENMEIWMKTVEDKFKNEEKFASLRLAVLDQQIIAQKLLITEIETHISSLDLEKMQDRAKNLLKVSKDQENFFTTVKKDLIVFNENREILLKWCEEKIRDLSLGHSITFLGEVEDNLKQKQGFLDETANLGFKLLENQRIRDKEIVEENLKELKDEWRGIKAQLQKKLGEVQTSTDTLMKLKDKVNNLSLKIDNLKIRLKMATTEQQIKTIEEDYREIEEELAQLPEENFIKQLRQKNEDFQKLLYNKIIEIRENEIKIEKIKFLDKFLSELNKKLDCLAPTSLIEADKLLNDLRELQLQIFEKQPLFEHFQYKNNVTEKMDSTLKWAEKYKEFYAIYELLSITEFSEVQWLHLGDIVKILLEDPRTDKSIEEKYLGLYKEKLTQDQSDPELKITDQGSDSEDFVSNFHQKIDDVGLDKLALDQLELQLKNLDSQYSEALQKKLNLKRAEVENSLIEEKEFKAACAKLQGWITLKMIPQDFAISADKIKLHHQFVTYFELQKEILEKEHEFVMLDKNNNESLSELLQENWSKLKTGTSVRLKSLQNCKESCDLFYGSLDGFLRKLKCLEVVGEKSFDDLKPRDLSTFEQDFEGLLKLGEDFLKLCDVDKKGVEDEIRGVSEKWSILRKKVRDEDQKLGEICLMIGDFMGELRELNLATIKGKYRELAKICSENNVNIQGITREYKKLVKETERRLQEKKDEELKKQKVVESLKEFRGSVEAQKSKLADLKTVESPVINKEAIEEYMGEIQNFWVEVEEIGKEVKVLELKAAELDVKVSEFNLKEGWDFETSKLDLTDSELDLKARELNTSNLQLNDSDLHLKASKLDQKESTLDLNSGLNLKDPDLDLETSKFDLRDSELDLKVPDMSTSKLQLNDSRLHLNASKLDLGDSKLDLNPDLDLKHPDLDLNTSKLDLKDSELNLKLQESKTPNLQLNDSLMHLKPSKLDLRDSNVDSNSGLDLKNPNMDLKTPKLDLRDLELDLKINTSKLDLNDSQLQLKASKWDLNSGLDFKDSNMDQKTSKLDLKVPKLHLETEIKPLKLKIDELQKQIKKETEKWGKTLMDLQEFTMVETGIKKVIEEADSLDFENLGKPQLRALEVKVLEPLEGKIAFFNNLGDCLLELTDEKSKCVEVKAKLMNVDQKNCKLREKINGQLDKLDLMLIEEGKIKEALQDLEDWLKDLEDTVEKLKAPSFDPKILKTQIVEVQKLQSKLLEGRKPWLNDEEKIEERLDNLDQKLGKRLSNLNNILEASENYYLQLNPILRWVEEAEQKLLKILDLDEEGNLTEKLNDLRSLQFKNQECLKKLENLTSKLTSLLQDNEAMELEGQKNKCRLKIEGLIKETDENIDLLEKLDKNLHSLHNFTQWLEKIEVKIVELRQIPVFEKQLQEHQKQLIDIKEDIEGHQMTIREIKDVLHLLPMTEDLNEHQINNIELKYQEILNQTLLLQKINEDFRPMVQDFHENHNSLKEWLLETQKILESPTDRDVVNLEVEVTEYKPLLDILSLLLTKMSEISPMTAKLSEELSKDNKKFEDLEREILKLSEKVAKNKRRFFEVCDEVDGLQNWLRNIEEEVNEIGRPSSDPYQISQQLTTQKQLQDHLNEKQNNIKLAIREVQEILRESPPNEDMATIKEKTEDLQETTTKIIKNNIEKINNLEEAMILAEEFYEAHNILDSTFEEIEEQVSLISDLQENNEAQQQTTDNKPLLEKLNKNGEALIQICSDDDTSRIQELVNNNNTRFSRIKTELRIKQENFEKTLMENSQLTDKLDGILKVLNHTATQVKNLEPIAANPEKIREQIQDNQILIEDLEKRREAYESVTEAAKTIIQKAGGLDLTDIKNKLQNLEQIWKEIQETTKKRGKTLQETLVIAQKFWDEVQDLRTSIKDIEEALESLEPPSAHFSAIKEQQMTLETIKQNLEKTGPNLDQLKQSGHNLIQICDLRDVPEIKKQILAVQENLETTTQHFWKREKNLISAMENAMEFHDVITTVQEFLDGAEDKFQKLKSNTTNLNEVQGQLEQLRSFKKEVEPHVIKLKTLTRRLKRQAQELSETTPTDHDDLVAKPLQNLKNRLDDLQLAISGQESDLERALLDLGNFDLAFNEFLAWLEAANENTDKIVPSIGNLEKLEMELVKMQVLVKDIQGHQTIMDNLQATNANPEKLAILNFKWIELTEKSKSKLKELEVLLKKAVKFTNEVNDELLFLDEVSNREVFRKPVGGLQETAAEQLSSFMVVFEEIEDHRPKIEALLQTKEVYCQKKLQILRHQWDLVTAKALDRKIKLEIALKEAQSFQDSFKEFADWLTLAEQDFMKFKPVSRVWNVVELQMEENKKFGKEIADHRAVMFNLDKKGTQLKYFTQREDSALIRNLLVSLQHRWDRINNKALERTRDLDQAYKEAREFTEAWTNITNWMTETEEILDKLLSNNLEIDSQKLRKIEDLLKILKDKQNNFDRVIRLGNSLKYKALKEDLPVINEMLSKLRDKFKTLTNKTIIGQRKLEKSLVQTGQYKDTIQSLTQWLKKSEKELILENPVHGDLDFVSNLLDNHRLFIDELESRADLIESLTNQPEFPELQELYKKVDNLTKIKTQKLIQALEDAQKLAEKIKQLTDWMTEAEEQLQSLEDIPDHENLVNQQLQFLTQFRTKLNKMKFTKDETCNFALEIIQKSNSEAIGPIKNSIKDINNQWSRISRNLFQRHQKLLLKLKFLEEFDRNLEDLIQWVLSIETKITEENQMDFPMEIAKTMELMDQHKRFMKEVEKRQLQIDKICRSRRPKTPKKLPLQLDIKPPRVQFLHDKWREVWFLLWDRQQKLRNHLVYLKDKEKADKFSWEDWRRRFLKFMGYKKSRVVDLLKKLDTDQNDLIPSEEFIEGILRTKFDTNRLEMLQLVKIFDVENKELIDWRQFLKALRPEWEEKPTNVDDAKILTEFKKIVMMCKCKDRIKVVHVGDGRYKIGDNQKIRLVRILKSTVMVRVGGGWVTLQEFLKKNDPCRTIGRTNLELREKYLLPEGASQALATFRSKFLVPSPKIIQGPVLKIREKTEKSLKMSYVTKTQFSYQSIQPVVRSKPNSRLGSRQNSFVKSRPASALGSRQGSFVLDGSKSRIPRLKLTNIPPPKQD